MKTDCKYCGRVFNIPDEKLKKGSIKIKCKGCGKTQIIFSKDKEGAKKGLKKTKDPIEEAVEKTLITESEIHKKSIFGDDQSGIEEKTEITKIKHAKNKLKDNEVSTHESTRIVSIEEIERLSGERLSAEQQKPQQDFEKEDELPFETTVIDNKKQDSTLQDVVDEWYIAIDDKPSGPITREELITKIIKGEIDRDDYVWKQGFVDWLPAGEVDELKDAFQDETEDKEEKTVIATLPFKPSRTDMMKKLSGGKQPEKKKKRALAVKDTREEIEEGIDDVVRRVPTEKGDLDILESRLDKGSKALIQEEPVVSSTVNDLQFRVEKDSNRINMLIILGSILLSIIIVIVAIKSGFIDLSILSSEKNSRITVTEKVTMKNQQPIKKTVEQNKEKKVPEVISKEATKTKKENSDIEKGKPEPIEEERINKVMGSRQPAEKRVEINKKKRPLIKKIRARNNRRIKRAVAKREIQKPAQKTIVIAGPSQQNSEKPAEVLPELDNKTVMTVIMKNKKDIDFCGKEYLKRGGQSGKVVVSWRVLPSGKVENVRIRDAEFEGTYLESCIVEHVRRWRFPAFSSDPRTINFPFKF